MRNRVDTKSQYLSWVLSLFANSQRLVLPEIVPNEPQIVCAALYKWSSINVPLHICYNCKTELKGKLSKSVTEGINAARM